MTNKIKTAVNKQKVKLAAYDNRSNTFIDFNPENSVRQSAGLLKGVKIAVKDNIAVKGQPLRAASKILEGFISPYDATVIKRLKEAGAIIVGRTNMDEFAMGSSTENSAFGPTLNPWDSARVPGGSSGGSAAAVADGAVTCALGSDTGGSIRQPAAFCGVFGHKPTYGSVSRYGLVALASSLDVIGPIAKEAKQAEAIFSVISGADEYDQTTIGYQYEPYQKKLSGLKIGLPRELWPQTVDQEIVAAVNQFVDYWIKSGLSKQTITLPELKNALAIYYIIMPCQAASNLARYDGIRYPAFRRSTSLLDSYLNTRSLFGDEAKRRIMLGTFALSAGYQDEYYQKARLANQQLQTEFDSAWQQVDLMICPTTPTTAFHLNERAQDPLKMYAADLLTAGVSLAGLPAISLPCGFDRNNLPIGAQIIAKAGHDNLLYALAKQYQAETNWHLRQP